jgi:transposase-like protein
VSSPELQAARELVRQAREQGLSLTGTRPETVLTEANGHVQIEVPRDRAGTFTPQIVRKRQRRLTGVDEMVLSLYAKGLTTGEISAHFATDRAWIVSRLFGVRVW